MKHTSPNGEYELHVSRGYIENGQRVEDGLKLCKDGALQFEKDLIGPSHGSVADDGTSIAVQSKNWDKPEEEWDGDDAFDILFAFDEDGNRLLKKRFGRDQAIFDCAIDGTGRVAAITGPDGGNVLLFDIETGDRLISRDYDEVQSVDSIERLRKDGIWLFELVCLSEETSILINDAGDRVVTDARRSSAGTTTAEQATFSDDRPPAELLEARGIGVPDTVFYLFVRLSDRRSLTLADRSRFDEILVEGPIYDPDWSDHCFVVLEGTDFIFIVGPDSLTDAAAGFQELGRNEGVDLYKWSPVPPSPGSAIPSIDELEAEFRPISRRDPTSPGFVLEDGTVTLDPSGATDGLAHRTFFGGVAPETADASSFGTSGDDLPDTEFGDLLRRVIAELSSTSVLSDSEINDSAEAHPQQVVDAFSELLGLLETGNLFESYDVDSRSHQPGIQPTFDIVAWDAPETVLEDIGRLEAHLSTPRSGTAPEVACGILRTLVEEHPEQFEEVIPTVDALLETCSPHPQRRAVDIIETALGSGRQDAFDGLAVASDSLVSDLLGRMRTTESAWLLKACCSVLHAYELDAEEYDVLADRAGLLVDTLRYGGARRGENIGQSFQMNVTIEGVESDPDGSESRTQDSPSSEALYRLHRAAGDIVAELAGERPDALRPYLDVLVDDLTADGESMKIVRTEARVILSAFIENVSGDVGDRLSAHDSAIRPLLESDDRHEVDLALGWLRTSGSQEAVDAFTEIHQDGTHPRWQHATTALEELAPDRIDSDVDPDNTYTEWLTFVTELAEEHGRLPTSSEATNHPEAPETGHWVVFDGWSDVLESLEIPTTRRTSNAPLRGRLVEDLQRVAGVVEGIPSTGDIDEHSDYSYYDFKEEFGGVKAARGDAGVERQ